MNLRLEVNIFYVKSLFLLLAWFFKNPVYVFRNRKGKVRVKNSLLGPSNGGGKCYCISSDLCQDPRLLDILILQVRLRLWEAENLYRFTSANKWWNLDSRPRFFYLWTLYAFYYLLMLVRALFAYVIENDYFLYIADRLLIFFFQMF